MNDIAKASLLLSMYKVIQRKKDPVQQAHLYNMVFQYLYENIIPSEDDEFFDLFISWQPQMDYELNAKLSGKKGREIRAEKNSESENVQNLNKNEDLQGQNENTVSNEETFFNSENTPYKGIQEPYPSNVNVNVNDNVNDNVNVNENAHENVNVSESDCAERAEREKIFEQNTQNPQNTQNLAENLTGWGLFQKKSFELIEKHNKTADYAKKIFIPNSFIAYLQKDCRFLVESLKNENPQTVLKALENYLQIASCDTWKNGFSLKNFVNEYPKYSAPDFNVTPFLKPGVTPPVAKREEKTPDEKQSELFEQMKDNPAFAPNVFEHYKGEWVLRGCPLGNDYLAFQSEKTCGGYGARLLAMAKEGAKCITGDIAQSARRTTA